MSQHPALSLSGISKTFGSTRALRQLHLDIHPGEVVALMGANGSGKSTLVRIISGVYDADEGEMHLRGVPYRPVSPRAARDAGIIAVHQIIADVGVPTLSVAENLCIDRLCGGDFPLFVGRRALKREAKRIAGEIGLDVDLDEPLSSLPIADQQLVAIARGLAAKPDLIIFDEPTASLSSAEADRLFQVINHLRAQNTAILYISHRIDDLRRVADRVVILRDGRVIGEHTRPIDFKAAITAMIGRELIPSAANDSRPTGETVLETRGLVLKPGATPFDMTLRQGEIVAVTGPIGSGKALLAETLAGIRRPLSGSIRVDGKDWRPHTLAEAISKGVFFAGEDRWRSSLFPAQVPFSTVAGTLSFPFLKAWFPWGIIGRGRENQAAQDSIAEFGIKCTGPGDRLSSLSGGNQQKVVLARWHQEAARLLLLVEPFQAVDVGAREDIFRLLKAKAADRATLVFVSDHEEAFEIADRILFMNHHSLVPVSDDGEIAELNHLGAARA